MVPRILKSAYIDDVVVVEDILSIDVIEDTIECVKHNDISQPLKPYLRFKDLKNRIIAMPAYVGGRFDVAGIKWIAGFPDNIHKGLSRANSITVLNNSDTGILKAIINSSLLSIIRTASVSGLLIKYFDRIRNLENIKIGVMGRGPIAFYHIKMCLEVFGGKIDTIYSNSLRPMDDEMRNLSDKIVEVESWEKAYLDSDIVITCTVSTEPYINKLPKKGALILNVFLRDFGVNISEYVKDSIIVDDWDNVCKSGTDMEKMHKEKGIKREDVKSFVELEKEAYLKNYDEKDTIMVNSMGMGIFDVAIGKFFYNQAVKKIQEQFLIYNYILAS